MSSQHLSVTVRIEWIATFEPICGQYGEIEQVDVTIAVQIGAKLLAALEYRECLVTRITDSRIIQAAEANKTLIRIHYRKRVPPIRAGIPPRADLAPVLAVVRGILDHDLVHFCAIGSFPGDCVGARRHEVLAAAW